MSFLWLVAWLLATYSINRTVVTAIQMATDSGAPDLLVGSAGFFAMFSHQLGWLMIGGILC